MSATLIFQEKKLYLLLGRDESQREEENDESGLHLDLVSPKIAEQLADVEAGAVPFIGDCVQCDQIWRNFAPLANF